MESYAPLAYVFLSGIGFSVQTLIIKLLEQDNFKGSFQCILCRGSIQFILSSIFICNDNILPAPKLFGDTNYVRTILFFRSVIGYGGIAFSFLAVEKLPVGDSTVLVMLSPLFAAIGGFIVLGEPWRLPEFTATLISLTGVALVARPTFLFGNSGMHEIPANPVGVLFAMIASVTAGIAYVLVRMLGTVAKMPWANVCFAQSLGQIFLSIPSAYLSGQVFTVDVSRWQMLLIFSAGFIGAWSQIAMTVGMQREKSATATAMRMSDVLFGFIWQVLFTSDAISTLSIIGAALVTVSIFIIVLCKPLPPQSPAPAPLCTDASSSRNPESTSTKSFSSTGNAKVRSFLSRIISIEPYRNIVRAHLRGTPPRSDGVQMEQRRDHKYSRLAQNDDQIDHNSSTPEVDVIA